MGRQGFSQKFHLRGAHDLVADLLILSLKILLLLQAAANGDAVVELVAGELDLLAMIIVLDQAHQMAGRQMRIVEELEKALRRQVAGVVQKPGGFLRIRRRRRRGRVLRAAPLQNMAAEETIDRHAGRLDPMALAEVRALLPAVARARGRIIEEEEKLIAQRDRPALGILGMPQPVME